MSGAVRRGGAARNTRVCLSRRSPVKVYVSRQLTPHEDVKVLSSALGNDRNYYLRASIASRLVCEHRCVSRYSSSVFHVRL